MGATSGGQRDRWESMRVRREQMDRDAAAFIAAYEAAGKPDPLEQLADAVVAAHARPDPAEAFAKAVSGLGRPKHQGVDAGRMIREGRAALAEIEAGRNARAQRNAAVARQAYRVYEQTRAKWRAEQDQAADDHEPSLMIAASMHLNPPRIRLF